MAMHRKRTLSAAQPPCLELERSTERRMRAGMRPPAAQAGERDSATAYVQRGSLRSWTMSNKKRCLQWDHNCRSGSGSRLISHIRLQPAELPSAPPEMATR